MTSLLLGKYKNIVLAIGLFIILDASILAMNFYISFALAGDAVAVAQAGRLQMMSQRLVKSMYELQRAMHNNDNAIKPFLELKKTYQHFDERLVAFSTGTSITSATGQAVLLKKVETEQGLALLRRMDEVWQPFKTLTHPIINTPAPIAATWFSNSLNKASVYAAANNNTLLVSANDLAQHLQLIATQKATSLRWVQSIGISLAIVNFIVIIFHFVGQLRETDAKIHHAQQQTRRILDNVGEGLFLLDENLNIGDEYSKKAKQLFGLAKRETLAGRNFIDLLRDKVGQEDLQSAKKYLGLLTSGQVKQNLAQDLNPLSSVKMVINQGAGRYHDRYLCFKFSHTAQAQQHLQILVTAQDVTQEKQLETKVEELQTMQGNQLLIVSKIVENDPRFFMRFVQDSIERLQRINAILQQPSRSHNEFHQQVLGIAAELHNLKGDAAAMGMGFVSKAVHDLEDVVLQLKQQLALEGDDFLPLTVQLKALLMQFEQYQVLAQQLNRMMDDVASTEDSNDLLDEKWMQHLVSGVASKNNKKARLIIQETGVQHVPQTLHRSVRDMVLQLVRNAICHGIEKVDQRRHKPTSGVIRVMLHANESELVLSVQDDGQGINMERLRITAQSSGRWTAQQLQAWDENQLLKLIFEPGLSTSEVVDEDAGRGIGMLAVKQMTAKLNARIGIRNEVGSYCRFTIRIPLATDLANAKQKRDAVLQLS